MERDYEFYCFMDTLVVKTNLKYCLLVNALKKFEENIIRDL